MTGAVALVLALISGSTDARASIFDSFGLGSRGVGMAGALTAASVDYAATFYNPADLLSRRRTHGGLGFVWLSPHFTVDRDLPQSPHPSVLPEQNIGVVLGLSAPLGGIFHRKVALGFALYLPLLRFTRAQFDDYRSPQLYLHDNLADKLLLTFGGAVEIMPWLRLGAGFQLLASLDGTADFQMDLVDGRLENEELSIDLHAELGATAGIAVEPLPGFELAIAYRQELEFQFTLPVTADIDEFGRLEFVLQGTSLYTPHQIAFGASYRVPMRYPLTIAADLTWAMWSLAPSPSPDVAFSIDGKGLLGENAGVKPLIGAVADAAPTQSKDILITRLGVELELDDWHLRAGYAYRPTPLPRPVADANFVDNDTHMLAVGAQWTFRSEILRRRKLLGIGLGVQAAIMEPRRVDKVDPADDTGGYRASGAVLNLTLDVSHDF